MKIFGYEIENRRIAVGAFSAAWAVIIIVALVLPFAGRSVGFVETKTESLPDEDYSFRILHDHGQDAEYDMVLYIPQINMGGDWYDLSDIHMGFDEAKQLIEREKGKVLDGPRYEIVWIDDYD